jgi:hypothetical protein
MAQPSSDQAVKERVFDRRMRDCDVLGDTIVSDIVAKYWEDLAEPPEGAFSPKDRFLYLLKHTHSAALGEDGVCVAKRRQALEKLTKIFVDIDICKQQKRDEEQSKNVRSEIPKALHQASRAAVSWSKDGLETSLGAHSVTIGAQKPTGEDTHEGTSFTNAESVSQKLQGSTQLLAGETRPKATAPLWKQANLHSFAAIATSSTHFFSRWDVEPSFGTSRGTAGVPNGKTKVIQKTDR